MRKTLLACCWVLVTTTLMPSCLGSDDDDVTLYDDVAITSFTLGTLNRYLTTTASTGADSTYKTTYKGSATKMTIDHLGGRIYNAEPLPIGTDLKHVLVTIVTYNSSLVGLKSLTSDTISAVSSTDSIDLSRPRVMRVYSTDGQHTRDYTVTLTARYVEQGTIVWTEEPAGTTMPSVRRTDWEFAFNADGTGLIATDDGWATQRAETLDASAELLPDSKAQFVTWPLANGLVYALLVGANDRRDAPAMTVWRKVIDTARPEASNWVYMPYDTKNRYYLPKDKDYWLAPYTGGSVLAIATDGTIYRSDDQGITWKTSSLLTLPAELTGTLAGATTDADGTIWVAEAETGRIWSGQAAK